MSNAHILALDVGEKRIGVALADTSVKIAVSQPTISVDGTEITKITHMIEAEHVTVLVVGYPRNQSGEPTQQTAYVQACVDEIAPLAPSVKIVYQDESLTSIKAEELLKAQKKPYQKSDIDAVAASLILQDYLEGLHGRF